jgi:hypothetical protein
MKPKPTPSIVQKPRTDPGRLSVRKGQIITLSTRSNKPKPFGKLETQRVRTSQAEMHEAFAAGWNAFLATHSGLLMAHGIKDFRVGFEQAWAKYWQSRKKE